jgi:hypothetical protein
MSSSPSEPSPPGAPLPAAPRFLFAALYAGAIVVLLDQSAELIASLSPLRFGEVEWRFGAFGLLVGRTTTAVLVDALLFIAAAGSGHRGLLRGLGVVHFVVAAFFAVGMGAFVLDVVELRRKAAPAIVGTFDLATARAAIVVVTVVVFCVWAGVALLRAGRRVESKSADGLLVVNRAR